MAWWSASDPRFSEWNAGRTAIGDDHRDLECCYSTCASCSASLYVLLAFNACTPSKVIEIGLEEQWPKEHLR
ncbi:hypothetical protein [Hahella sp. HN01]|uniref:hypothetical protein n=1 Tax=Hahella sp. HN01 TaxID=2847262 RepID=UPI001C1EC102|nr:hypothetical protein [Hahella sp. HN01]MBU6950403.1 hypothetical protein [Hahella sp. HN01]